MIVNTFPEAPFDYPEERMTTDTRQIELNKKLSRRSFLGTLTASTAGLLLIPYIRSASIFAYGHASGASFLAQVALTQGDNYARSFVKQKVQHLFESLGGLADVVKTGDKVGIKINLTGGSGSALSPRLGGLPITESMWTHPEVIRAVGELLIDSGVRGSDIYIVESLWDAASYNDFGYLTVQQSLGAQMVNLNNKEPYTDYYDLPVGGNTSFYTSFKVNKILNDVNVFVSIPKMKQHYEAGVTGALKNQIGMVPKQLYTMPSNQSRRDALHTQGGLSNTHLPRSICDLNFARPVHLAVIDGMKNARGGEGVWNPTFQIAQDHVMLAGKNPVATDSIMAYLMGINPQATSIPLPDGGHCDNYLELLHQKGMGTNQMNEIEVVGDGASLVTSVGPQKSPPFPEKCELLQNYPNPFNPSTMFRFYLPSEEHVVIMIRNLMGQEIETLIEGIVPQGLHEIHWTPRGIASGVYFCEMRGRHFLETRKIIYQK